MLARRKNVRTSQNTNYRDGSLEDAQENIGQERIKSHMKNLTLLTGNQSKEH